MACSDNQLNVDGLEGNLPDNCEQGDNQGMGSFEGHPLLHDHDCLLSRNPLLESQSSSSQFFEQQSNCIQEVPCPSSSLFDQTYTRDCSSLSATDSIFQTANNLHSYDMETMSCQSQTPVFYATSPPHFSQQTNPVSELTASTGSPVKQGPSEVINTSMLQQICFDIHRDMSNYGLCVIDNFLSSLGMIQRRELLWNEVQSLYDTPHVFREGGLVSDRLMKATVSVRGDRIVWVNGTEQRCFNIGFLIRTLDTIVSICSNSLNANIMQKCNIRSRTKAMVACYPGEGSQYVKHIDNPNEDGRCVTCIYYLNKNWQVDRDGGLLRLFPQGDHLTNKVANIEPIFDRLIFFWSDRRNPHEVQKAYNVRFAITVWYFNHEERQEALRRKREATGKPTAPDPQLWPFR